VRVQLAGSAPAHRRTRLSFRETISDRVGDRTDKTQGWVYMAYTERPSCPGALLR
jgi:hypothetical protein